MPQLDLYGADKRTSITWRYSIDPLKPSAPAMFYVMVEGPRQLAVEHGLVHVPLNVVWEEVDDLLTRTWSAYLFGERDDVRKAVKATHADWKWESELRPST